MAKIEQEIIKFLSNYPEREFYAQEIGENVQCSKASASNILKSLANEGVVFTNTRGHMKFHRINQKNLKVRQLKINFVLEKLNLIVPKLQKVSQKIFLFGSASRGEQTFNSDIDLFVITSHMPDAAAILKKTGKNTKIKAIIKTPSEWSEMEIKEPEFYQEVKNGIILYNYVPRI